MEQASVCAECGAQHTYETATGRAKKWCSRECYRRHYYRTNIEMFREKNLQSQRNRMSGTCPDCGCKILNTSKRCNACRGKSAVGTHRGGKGRSITSQGYVMLYRKRDHPNAHKNGAILEHVYVMSEKLGRPLLPGENVHHINGVRDDNRPENLELWLRSQPPGQRVTDIVAWAREILDRYGDMP